MSVPFHSFCGHCFVLVLANIYRRQLVCICCGFRHVSHDRSLDSKFDQVHMVNFITDSKYVHIFLDHETGSDHQTIHHRHSIFTDRPPTSSPVCPLYFPRMLSLVTHNFSPQTEPAWGFRFSLLHHAHTLTREYWRASSLRPMSGERTKGAKT
jgi:hypothetical protein